MATLPKHFEISYTIPSKCAAALAANEADIGIIPAITYAEIPGLVILPNIAIAAKDHVRSILLVSRKPWEEVQTVAADTSSRTSVALAQVLFAKFLDGPRQFTPHAPNLEQMLAHYDAALLIGDPALVVASVRRRTISTILRMNGGNEPASRLSSPSGRCGSMR